MKLSITQLSNTAELIPGDIKIYNNFYHACSDCAGIVSAIRNLDDWIEGETAWTTRSSIPFVSALRLSQITDEPNSGAGYNPSPKITVYGVAINMPGIMGLSRLPDYSKFPSAAECISLIKLNAQNKSSIKLVSDRKIDVKKARNIYKHFDYKNDLLIRSGACLYKAHLLQDTSTAFAEEIYINLYIAFEAIIEYLKKKYSLNRRDIIQKLAQVPGNTNFIEYEEEMRDYIRNSIIHPWRENYKETVLQPIYDIDFIFEDLPFVDWLFRRVILGNIFS